MGRVNAAGADAGKNAAPVRYELHPYKAVSTGKECLFMKGGGCAIEIAGRARKWIEKVREEYR